MAKGAELVVGGGCPPHMVYVRVAPDLKARSLGWSQAWHDVFKRAVFHLRWEVAGSVMNGLPMVAQAVEIALPGGACIEVCVACSGTQIVIHVLDFVGPHNPGPDGGICPPRAAEGSAHGAYRRGSELRLVAFYESTLGERLESYLRLLWTEPSLTSAGMERDCASHSSRGAAVRTPSWVSKERPAVRTCETRKAQHVVLSQEPVKAASRVRENLPIMFSSRSAPAIPVIVDNADLRAGAAPLMPGSPIISPSAQDAFSITRRLAAKPIIAPRSRLRPHAGANCERRNWPVATHARHLPQQHWSGHAKSLSDAAIEPRPH